jgi:hypothetical protein
MTKSVNKAALFTALNKFVGARVSFIQSVIDAGYPTIESARADIMEWIVTKISGVTLETKGTGRVVFVGEKASSARTLLADINTNLRGQTRREVQSSKKKTPIKVSKAVILSIQAAMVGLTKAEASEAVKQALEGLSFE